MKNFTILFCHYIGGIRALLICKLFLKSRNEIIEIASETPDERIEKLIQLMRGTLLMAKNKKLTTAKNKLREIFYLEFLTQSYSNLYYYL